MELLSPANIAQHREEGAWPRGPEQWPCAEVLIPWLAGRQLLEAGIGERAEDCGILSVGRRTLASKGKFSCWEREGRGNGERKGSSLRSVCFLCTHQTPGSQAARKYSEENINAIPHV